MPFRGKDGRRYPRKSNRIGARAFPLHKIVGTRMEPIMLAPGKPSSYERLVEVLECGHTQAPRQDCIGETVANSRRCAKCLPNNDAQV
jgi:hypothetical protein